MADQSRIGGGNRVGLGMLRSPAADCPFSLHASHLPSLPLLRKWLMIRIPWIAQLSVGWLLVVLAVVDECCGDDRQFQQVIRPLLSDRCFRCHGPDAGQRAADLRLDVREEALRNQVIVPGQPENSGLVARILSDDPDVRMPPPAAHKQLSANERQQLVEWIRSGAAYETHWSFQPIVAPTVPHDSADEWSVEPIDRFVWHGLQRATLEPAPRASREALIRRITFDLTGLPPTLDEIDAFLADKSPQAWERVIDRLLASPHYGERMTADWLDVSRYSDSYGFQVDRDRFVWPWRDWVIEAFNDNLPWDDFLTWQLAGDLLPNASRKQILATTFCRLHPQEAEGGSVPEEYRVEYTADRTQTFGTAVLGLTVECARCHDHKFDPLSQREYYQLYAFFNQIDEAGLYSFFTDSIPTPTLSLPTPAQEQELARLALEIERAERELEQYVSTAAQPDDKQLAAATPTLLPGPILTLEFDEPAGAPNLSREGRFGGAVQLTGDDPIKTEVGNYERWQPFSISLWLQIPESYERAVVLHRSRAWTDAASRGYELLIEEGRLSAALIHFWPGNAIRVRSQVTLPLNSWQHIVLSWDGSSRASGLHLWLNGEKQPTDVVRDNLTRQITGGGGDEIAIGQRFRDQGLKHGSVDRLHVFDRELCAWEVAQLAQGQVPQWPAASPTGAAGSSGGAEDSLLQAYVRRCDPEGLRRVEWLRECRRAWCALADQIPEIMVMQDRPGLRDTHVLLRGAYDAPGESVAAQVPAIFPALPADGAPNRLALARWLTSPEHPLTARVAVNRFWQQMFGTGLVRTPEDFGSQGLPPAHPELLDWLAADFVAHGWDVKRLLRMIALSATYQQSSSSHEPAVVASWTRDPENIWLARFPARRLTAEMFRDQALALGGFHSGSIGGPPVKPYEIEESFKPRQRDRGPNLYRRSLYTYWRRTAAPPVMLAFDASGRETCRVRRETTASPLQTLVLLNGPEFVESARGLAGMLIRRHGPDGTAILIDAFRLLTGRRPDADELSILQQLLATELERFRGDPTATAAYLAVGDARLPADIDTTWLAAVAVIGQALFNYHDSVVLP